MDKCSFLEYLTRSAFMLLKTDQICHLPQWATVCEEQSVAGAEENLMSMFLQNPHSSVNLFNLGS